MSRVIHLISKGVLSLIMLFSVYNYLFNHTMVVQAYQMLGYPSYLIYPSAFLKLSGLVVLWFSSSQKLNEWAYAGFTYLLALAFFSHVMIGDGQFLFSFIAFVALIVSYVSRKK